MKKSISNRDLRRIADHAGTNLAEVRAALARGEAASADLRERIEQAARELNYTVTLRDRVAMAADVSIATVNRSYRPAARDLVRQEVRERIEAAAARLGYVPDVFARRQRVGGSNIVAICPEAEALFEPYYAYLLKGLTGCLAERGLHPVIAPVQSGQLLPHIALSSTPGTVVLFENALSRERVQALERVGRRVVLIGRHESAPCVSPEWTSPLQALTARALERGFDVLHLGIYEFSLAFADRALGVVRALDRLSDGARPAFQVVVPAGLDVDQEVERWRLSGAGELADAVASLCTRAGLTLQEEGQSLRPEDTLLREVERLGVGRDRTMAFLGLSSTTAIRLYHRLHRKRPELVFGRDVAVSANEDILPRAANSDDQLLTCVSFDIDRLINVASQLVLEATAGQPARAVTLPATVTYRESL